MKISLDIIFCFIVLRLSNLDINQNEGVGFVQSPLLYV